VLRSLLVKHDWPVHEKGVQLHGIRISGDLDLTSAVIAHPLILKDCFLDSENFILLKYATIQRLDLIQCVLPGIHGDMLEVRKDLHLTGSYFSKPEALCLGRATISGDFSLCGAKLWGAKDNCNSIDADGISVGGSASLGDGFESSGAVRMVGANIGGQLNFQGANLMGFDADGDSLCADELAVGGSLLIDKEFVSAGCVRLKSAKVGGLLSCSGAHLRGRNKKHESLHIGEISVEDDVLLGKGFTASGTVVLRGARVAGSIKMLPQALAEDVALLASGMRTGQHFTWLPAESVKGAVDLQNASVRGLFDSWNERERGHWPPPGKLQLSGFTYGRLTGTYQGTAEERRDWIAKSPRKGDFSSQPYEHLVNVYRQAGNDSDARTLAIARRRDLRTYGQLNRWRRFSNWLLDKTIKYGYQTWRALLGLVVLYVITWAVFWVAQHDDAVMVPAKPIPSGKTIPTALECSEDYYTCFHPAGYALDLVVPVINVHQADNWRPNGAASYGNLYEYSSWIAIGLGYAFTTLAVVGYTGLVRRE
jgi:hypothetical protein